MIARSVFIVAAYLAAALLSSAISGPLSGCPLVWLPYSVGLAAFLTYGIKLWPTIAFAAILASVFELRWLETSTSSESLAIAVLGGTLAAIVGPGLGAVLIRRWTTWPNAILSESGATRFYLLGGLASGVCGAIIVAGFWIKAGFVPVSTTGYFLMTEILGRSLGAVVIAPMLLSPCCKTDKSRSRLFLPMLIPRLLALGATLTVLAYVSTSSRRTLQNEFAEVTFRTLSVFERLGTAHLESLMSIRNLWYSSHEVENPEFQTFVTQVLEQNSGFDLLLWAPVVQRTEIEQLEALLRPETTDSTAPTPPLEESSIVNFNPADLERGKILFPVLYSRTRPESGDYSGFEISSVKAITEAIELARNRKSPQSTRPFFWNNEVKIAILLWIEREPLPAEKARTHWIHDRPGLALAIVDLKPMLEETVKHRTGLPLEISLRDLGRETDPIREDVPPPFVEFNPSSHDESSIPPTRISSRVNFAGRVWMITATAHQPIVVTNPPWSPITAQAACLALVTLLGVLLMSATGHAENIRGEVLLRTAELTESQERFNQLADNVDESFWITTSDGKKTEYLSPGFEKIWGLARERVDKDPLIWRNSIHKEDSDRYDRRFSLEGASTEFDEEYRITRPDGSIRWIRDRGFPVKDKSGKVIRFAGVAEDVTEKKISEQALLASIQAEEEANKLLKVFFQVSLDLLCIAGTDGFFKQVNPAFNETLGYSTEKLLGCPFLDFVHPDDVSETVKAVEQLARGNSLIRFQNRYRDNLGRYLWLEWSAVPESKGELIYAAARNITEQKLMEEELLRSNAELEQFAYIASHDLQEPLRAVTSFAQLLKRRYQGKIGEEADDYILHIVDGSERMRRLILGLLELSRIARNGSPLTVMESSDGLAMAIQNLSVAIEESGAVIHQGRLPPVMADRDQLVRLFQNLISNAIKYSLAGPPVISVGALEQDGMWVFSVDDNGPGIDPGQRERVFEIFKRLHTQAEVPGTGIGLSICSRIVNRHGGKIWAESSASGGSSFRFTLPVLLLIVKPPGLADKSN